jgi:FdhD protein
MSHLNKSTAISWPVPAIELCRDGKREVTLALAEEVPCAFRYNGFPHAVMMATPADLEDFALGFSLTEGVIQDTSEVRGLLVVEEDEGIALNVELAPASLHSFLSARRVRQLHGHTSCGLCGIEDLRDIRRPNRHIPKSQAIARNAIDRAINRIREYQPLSRETRAAHAAASVDGAGKILTVREDVGRHNALDKLIGSRLRERSDWRDGFCLITSRCSYEMAQKAIAAGIGTLVAISAPTAKAVRTAHAAGLTLYSLSGDGEKVLYTGSSANGGAIHLEQAC